MADLLGQRARILAASLFMTAVVSVGMARLQFNDDWIGNFSTRYELRRAADSIQQNLTGLFTIEYALNAGQPEGIYDPAYLATVERFAPRHRRQPHVVHVASITDTLEKLSQNLHGDDPAWFRVPDRKDLGPYGSTIRPGLVGRGLHDHRHRGR